VRDKSYCVATILLGVRNPPFVNSVLFHVAINIFHVNLPVQTIPRFDDVMSFSFVRSEVLRTVIMKNGVFWDVKPYGSFKNCC
jgi:hypothetical protein